MAAHKQERKYWRDMRGKVPPKADETFDNALGDDMMVQDDLHKEEVWDTIRGEQDLATEDPGLMDFQHNVMDSIKKPLYVPVQKDLLKHLVEEDGTIPGETQHFAGE